MSSWDKIPVHKVRAFVRSALRTIKKFEGGPFSYREISEIVQERYDGITSKREHHLDMAKNRCRTLILRLSVCSTTLVSGLDDAAIRAICQVPSLRDVGSCSMLSAVDCGRTNLQSCKNAGRLGPW